MELSSSNQNWCCFNFTNLFFEETTAELVKSPASLIHQPLHDSAYRHIHSSPSGNLHITEDKQNDLEEYKDDFIDEFVARVNEERAKDTRNIFIFHLNVISLQKKIEEVVMLIDKFKAQVVFLTETKIDGSYPNSKFAIERYKKYGNNRKKGAGGVLANVSSTLASKRLSLPWSFSTIEVLAIEITLGRHEAMHDWSLQTA